MKYPLATLVVLLIIFALQGCVVFAPPSPLVTYGGPQTTPEKQSEVGIGLGSGAALFEDAHAGGVGYLLRYKYGVTKKYDLGVDALGVIHGDKSTFTAKLANRLQVAHNWRVEAGIGLADDSEGKSLNGDAAVTWGTRPEVKVWNVYSSFRIGAAKGYPGNLLGSGEKAPPDTWFSVLNVGTQGNISESHKFIFEGGYGYVFPQGEKAGPVFYLSGGMLFYLKRTRE